MLSMNANKINWTKNKNLLIMPSKEEMRGYYILESLLQSLQKSVNPQRELWLVWTNILTFEI
jgi:hypothetical protein